MIIIEIIIMMFDLANVKVLYVIIEISLLSKYIFINNTPDKQQWFASLDNYNFQFLFSKFSRQIITVKLEIKN